MQLTGSETEKRLKTVTEVEGESVAQIFWRKKLTNFSLQIQLRSQLGMVPSLFRILSCEGCQNS